MINILDFLIHFIADFLRFSREHVMIYSLPTNPVSAIIYLGIAYYGYTKLKEKICLDLSNKLDLSKLVNNILVFLYSLLFLSCINFLFENVWLTSFMSRYYLLNNGWLNNLYFPEPSGWLVNYLRNTVYFFFLYVASRDILKYVNINKHTLIASTSLCLYLIGMFFLTPHYGYIDWTFSIMWERPDWEIVFGFLISVLGKPLLFYTFYSLWIPVKKKESQVIVL